MFAVLMTTIVSVLAVPQVDAASLPSIVPFVSSIDAVSVSLTTQDATTDMRFRLEDGSWSNWQHVSVNAEQDPRSLESALIMSPSRATALELRNEKIITAVNPITISAAPVSYFAAATSDVGSPRILKRSEWGADDELLYVDTEHTPATQEGADNGGSGSAGSSESQGRIDACNTALKQYPEEFQTDGKVITKGSNGRTLRWKHTYSKDIRELVVHHTAIAVTGDTRPGPERVRALYQYHSVNRGWGDIGYHYLVDEDGQIYEGKSGGDLVVGGHAYCNNVGTIGIALLGNFEEEEPSQDQMHSLQWLLDYLSKKYNLNPGGNARFHGELLPPIVGHGDLLSTDCPGYYVKKTLSQVRRNVIAGNLSADITFPPPPQKPSKPTAPKPTIPEQQSEDQTGEFDRRLGRIQRKIITAVRLSTKGGGRAATLASQRRGGGSGISRITTTSRTPSSVRSVSSSSRSSVANTSSADQIRVRLTKQDKNLGSCSEVDFGTLRSLYRGQVTCITKDDKPMIINTLSIEDYLMGLSEEPDTEPYEKQRAFAIAARSYAAYYMESAHRKFPGMPYDASDDPATFQAYAGRSFESSNPNWLDAVRSTNDVVLTKNNEVLRAPYFSVSDGRTRSPEEIGWKNFPFASTVFTSKPDPWCNGMQQRGHGVGMSGCGAKGQAQEGKTAEQILQYYYPTTVLKLLSDLK